MKSSRSVAAAMGGLLLGLSAPPAVVPLAEWLVVPGLAVWFALALSRPRALRNSYLFGCVYMAWFSWSVHHIGWPPYLGIVFVGGLYFLLGSAVVRAAPERWRSIAFAVAVGGTFWLRATMPDIHYPHGQPCHALWQWPWLMHIVVVGGEPLMNALLGLLAATGFELIQSHRVARPPWRKARWRFGAALAAFLLCALWGNLAAPDKPAGMSARTVRIAVIEPGFHPLALWEPPGFLENYRRVLEERLIAPTLEVLSDAAPPDLILWPESSILDREAVLASDIAAQRAAVLPRRFPESSTRIVLGANVRVPAGLSPSALLVELPSGRILEHHDKQRLVPGGEFLPLVGLLPQSWADYLRAICQETFRTPPDCVAGVPRPPMTTAAGVPFGALICYDNAFPGPATELVTAGAEFLVVLSNEAWYRGGAELNQLVAMTVVRALENSVPMVRCTLDGHSVAIGQDGRVLAGLEIAPAPQSAARILQVSIDRATGGIPPMAWLRRTCGAVLGLLVALGAAHGLGMWVRIRAAKTALPAAAGSGQSRAD